MGANLPWQTAADALIGPLRAWLLPRCLLLVLKCQAAGLQRLLLLLRYLLLVQLQLRDPFLL